MEVPKAEIDEERNESNLNEESKRKRRRKQTNYKKISNQTRQKLIEMVYLNDYLLKDAAKTLGINYSTAKTILRIFRIEKRIEKKNAEEERELKEIIFKFKNGKVQNENLDSENRNDVKKEELTITNQSFEENKVSTDTQGITIPSFNINTTINEIALKMDYFNKNLNEFNQTVQECLEQVKSNQVLIQNIFSFFTIFSAFSSSPSTSSALLPIMMNLQNFNS